MQLSPFPLFFCLYSSPFLACGLFTAPPPCRPKGKAERIQKKQRGKEGREKEKEEKVIGDEKSRRPRPHRMTCFFSKFPRSLSEQEQSLFSGGTGLTRAGRRRRETREREDRTLFFFSPNEVLGEISFLQDEVLLSAASFNRLRVPLAGASRADKNVPLSFRHSLACAPSFKCLEIWSQRPAADGQCRR